jgi:hypothetical protein
MVNSFDVFDTILGRRCGGAQQIWEEVERDTGFLGFVEARSFAEGAIQRQSIYTLANIYDELARQQGLPKVIRDRLEAAELAVETRNAFLIQSVYKRVIDGDILVSDMYMDERQIRKLLDAAGFKKEVTIYVTNDGKRTGCIWPRLKSSYAISLHTGDNLFSDVEMPCKHGITTEHYSGAALNSCEQQWLQTLPFKLVYQIRFARLCCPYSLDSNEAYLWTLQCNINFPILYAACLLLYATARGTGCQKLLFATRDGYLMRRLFQVLYPEFPAYELWTSRVALNMASDSYIQYLNKYYTPDSIFVELDATGRALLGCVSKLASFPHKIFTVLHLNRLPESPQQLEPLQVFKVTNQDRVNNPGLCVAIERLNRDLTGRIADIQGHPVFEDRRYDPNLVRPCHQAMDYLLNQLPRVAIKNASEVVEAGLRQLGEHVQRLWDLFYKDNT